MRSIATTFVLALTAAISLAAAVWQFRQGNFDSFFGAPPTPVGQRIYSSFKPDEVKHIRVTGNGANATFSLEKTGWQASTPWADRMDPRAAISIIKFTLGMRVEDLAGEDEIIPSKSGLGENSIGIRLEDKDHNPLAKYNLGRVTPWKAEIDGMDQLVPTVFVQPRDKNHKRHIYSCTGDITPLFKDGLKFLRDHRPFYFSPSTLGKIRIRTQQGDLTLGRENEKSPWRIVKPLDLPTDPKGMKTLIENLFDLQAIKVSDRSSVTLPSIDPTVKTSQIALVPFGSDKETLLEILPPGSAQATQTKGTVSDRPDTVFDLPLKPEPGLVSLADLPLSVNELRDPTLTHLNIQSLRGISIESSTGSPIILSRMPSQPWMFTSEDLTGEANEENLYKLLKAVTTGRATGFESDAATDFTPWGLSRPFLRLRLLGEDNQAIEFRFGIDSKGSYFVNRLGTPTVMKVDPSMVSAIAVRPYEWRHSRLWSLDRVNLSGIERKEGEDTPLVLKYKFIDETWKADRNGTDVSASLDPARANFLLSTLEGLRVSRWLATGDPAAESTLLAPSLSFGIIEKTVDEEGNISGVSNRRIILAPNVTKGVPGYYYGRLSGEPHPFLLDRETYQKLTVDLFDK